MRGMTLREENVTTTTTKKKEGDFLSQLARPWITHLAGHWVKNKRQKNFQLNHNYWITTQLPKTDQTYKEISPHYFFFTFLNVYVTSTSIHHISYHIMTALYPSHDISFKMLHYNYYIKCRTSIWVLNTYFKGYKDIYLWEK